MSRTELLTGAAVVTASGAAWALCFGREASLWLGWVALAPFVVVVGHPRLTARQAALAGFAHGFVTWLIAADWIPPTISTFGHLPLPLTWFFLALMCCVMAPYPAFFAVLGRRLVREGGLLALFALPALWVALEWLRGNIPGFLSFPWNLAAYAWVEVPGALPLAAWVGSWGVSYLVLLANVGLALAWRRRSPMLGVSVVLTALLVLMFAARFSRPEEGSRSFGRGTRSVALVQPNQTLQPDDGAVIRRQYDQIILTSNAQCRGTPTLLIWPESAAWPFTWEGSAELRRDLRRLALRGCHVIFNTPTLDQTQPDSYFNSALLISADGEAGRYDKRNLVPWGEHVPLGDVLPFVDKLARFAGRFSAGREPSLLEWDDERVAMAICYEAIFPGPVAEQVRSGATLLVNISNDAWYGDSSAPRQLFRAARFRAAENRRVMLRAALTGISGVIDARGAVTSRLELGERGVLRQRLKGSAELSPYTRAPWLVPLACTILAIFAIFLSRRTMTPSKRNVSHDSDRNV